MGPPTSIRNNIPPGPSVIVGDIFTFGPWSAGPYHTGYYARPFTRIIRRYVTAICACVICFDGMHEIGSVQRAHESGPTVAAAEGIQVEWFRSRPGATEAWRAGIVLSGMPTARNQHSICSGRKPRSVSSIEAM